MLLAGTGKKYDNCKPEVGLRQICPCTPHMPPRCTSFDDGDGDGDSDGDDFLMVMTFIT